jgi:hypothetical protein
MKPLRPILLIASIALNAALALVLLLGAISPGPAAGPPPGPKAQLSALHPPPRLSAPTAPDPATWSRLHSDSANPDFPALVARLRSAGFPPAVIRGIVTSLLKTQFDARRRALDPAAGHRPYWQNDRTPDPQAQLARHALDREFRHQLFDLLGADATEPDPTAIIRRRQQLADLPPERAAQVGAIIDRYDRLRVDVPGPGGYSPADRLRYVALDEAQHAEIAKLLSPGELAAYDLRASTTSEILRSRLALFDPSESEFLTLYQLRRLVDEQLARGVSLPESEQSNLRTTLEKNLKDQILAALGPDRAADYERTTDFNYRQTAQLVSRLALPPSAATQVWTVQKEIQQRAEPIRADTQLTPDQRTAQLAALAAEATTRVTTVLGPRGFSEYQNNGGNWLSRLTPPASPYR